MSKKVLPYILAIIFFLIFLLMGILIITDHISSFDTTIYQMIISHNNNLTHILKGITEFGDAIILIILTLFILLVFKERKIGFLVSINLIVVFIIGQITKYIFVRPRPSENVLIEIDGFSFPSGHSIVSIVFYGFLIYLCLTKISNKFLKYFLSIFMILLIITIGYSRIYLGVHYPSDVIGGFSFGLCLLILYIELFAKKILK